MKINKPVKTQESRVTALELITHFPPSFCIVMQKYLFKNALNIINPGQQITILLQCYNMCM